MLSRTTGIADLKLPMGDLFLFYPLPFPSSSPNPFILDWLNCVSSSIFCYFYVARRRRMIANLLPSLPSYSRIFNIDFFCKLTLPCFLPSERWKMRLVTKKPYYQVVKTLFYATKPKNDEKLKKNFFRFFTPRGCPTPPPDLGLGATSPKSPRWPKINSPVGPTCQISSL